MPVGNAVVEPTFETLAEGARSFAPQLSQNPAPSSFDVPHLVQKIAMTTPFASYGLIVTRVKIFEQCGYVSL